jgi:ribosomal protein S18 acetylase RimI-like enzyme
MTPVIRWIQKKYLPEILKIEKENFEFPWAEVDFTEMLADDAVTGMVATINGVAVGYMIYSVDGQSILLLNIAVDKEHQRQGIASQLVYKLINKKRKVVVALVRETNLDAQLFLKKLDFWADEIVREHYDCEDHYEDAYMMSYSLGKTAKWVVEEVGSC